MTMGEDDGVDCGLIFQSFSEIRSLGLGEGGQTADLHWRRRKFDAFCSEMVHFSIPDDCTIVFLSGESRGGAKGRFYVDETD